MQRHVKILKKMMKILERDLPDKFCQFGNTVYYKEQQLYFELFIQTVDDILYDRNLAAIGMWIDKNQESNIDLQDVCIALGWPVRYCRAMLLDLIAKVRMQRGKKN